MSKILTIPEQHQLKIAKQTLKYSDIGCFIVGGMTKVEAIKIIKQLTKRRRNNDRKI